jgi:hypothetical protein
MNNKNIKDQEMVLKHINQSLFLDESKINKL